MSQNKIDYPEQIYKAIDIITNKRLEALQYDITIEATIINDTQAEKGVYTVSNGNANFLAYSKDSEYKNDDVVMVTIPQGNYNNQKIIVGKKINEEKEETPIEFKRPFSNLINITNNILNNENQKKEYSFIANGEEYCWDITTSDILQSSYHQNDYISMDLSEIGYTRVGVKADFLTTLKEYQVISGNYGLEFILTFSNDPLSEENIIRTFSLDSSNFFGNIYNLDIYQNQELVFDISDMENYILKKIQICPYQRKNFKNINNEDISDKVPFDNIFIKNIYICLGTSAIDFDKDSVKITTKNSLLYSKNNEKNNVKILNLQWIHKNENNNIIKVVQEDEIPIKYHIWWYIYDRESSDLYAGAGWKRFYGCKTTMNPKTGDYLLKKEEIKNEELNLRYPEDVTDHLEDIYFFPNGNEQTQQLKVIIVKEKNNINEENAFTDNSDIYFYDKIVESPIFVLENQNEVANKQSIIDANALSIKIDDNSYGNYCLYNRAGNILLGENTKLRTLTAVFDPYQNEVYNKSDLSQPYSFIKWIIPASNTMIIPIVEIVDETEIIVLQQPSDYDIETFQNNHQGANEYPLYDELTAGKGYKIIYNISQKTFEYVAEDIISNQTPLVKIGYYIKDFLNYSNNRNTISLEILKEGSSYNALINLSFSNSGVSGSDYDIKVDWSDNAFDINKGVLSGRVILMKDQNEIDIGSGEYEYSWYKVNALDKTSNQQIKFDSKIETNKELYYPVTDGGSDGKLRTHCDCMYIYINSEFKDYGDNGTGKPKYWISGYNKEYNTDQLAWYDVTNKEFKDITSISDSDSTTLDNYQEKIIYSKTSEDKRKITFKPFDFVSTDKYNNKEGVVIFNNNKSTYYYSSIRRAFVKCDGRYIIDPWDKYRKDIQYYYPDYTDEKIYDYNTHNILKIINDNSQPNSFIITDDENHTRKPSMQDLYILQITLNNFIDYPLTAYFPIALKNSDINKNFIVSGIEGPTEVRYSTDGELDFNRATYAINASMLTSERQYKRIPFYEQKTAYKKNSHQYDPIHYYRWIIILPPESGNINFYPQLEDLETKKTGAAGYQPILNPPTVYFENQSFYGVSFIVDQDIYFNDSEEVEMPLDNNEDIKIPRGTILWTQPIYSYQEKYPSTTLNNWNGREILTDDNTGIILAKGFSAGKKETDNTFTGVVIGDWSKTDSNIQLTKDTGVFGFNHGAMSYALKDDGTAFFGKDGKGRIYFDGNSAQIYSANWIEPSYSNGLYDIKKRGMMLDIDDGIINIISPDSTINFKFITDSTKPNFEISYNNYDGTSKYEKIIYEDGSGNSIKDIYYNTIKLSIDSPFISIGPQEKRRAYNGDLNSFWPGEGISFTTDFIRINDHGGYLTSFNYLPTLSDWLKSPTTNNDYYLGTDENNNLNTIYPDTMIYSYRHCWGNNTKFPFTGFVIDLTHGAIVLGNDSEIKGYQTGQWGPSQSSIAQERVFHISNGGTTVLNDGVMKTEANGAERGYFLLAQTINNRSTKKLPTQQEYQDVFRVSWNGNITCSGQISSGSSIKLKKNINYNINSELLYKLSPVSFQYKESNNINYGFIAEDVYKVLPEVVQMKNDNSKEIFGLNYNSIFTLAVAEIQKLRKELNNLKQKLEIKENKNEYDIN